MGVENSQEKDWQRLKEQYLKQIEDVLVDSEQPNVDGIVNDVRSHLDRRYAELPPQRRRWENFQSIITEMGPPSEYAELASEKRGHTAKKVSAKYVVILAVILTVLTGATFLLPVLLPKCTVPTWTDKMRSAFAADPEVVGNWVSVDFVSEANGFNPGSRQRNGDLFLKDMVFNPDGTTNLDLTWSKGLITDRESGVKAEYEIKHIDGTAYLFLPWLSGDVTIRHQKPQYYILKKVSETIPQQQAKDEKVTAAAIEAAKGWLKLVDDGQYSQSWSHAAEYFRKNVSEEQWSKAIEPVRKPLGKVLSRKVINSTYTTSLPGAPDGQYVVIQFETSFENKRNAVETVTPMLGPNGRWRVSGYYIR